MKLELMRGITGVVNIVVVVLVCSAKPASSSCKTAGSQPAQQLVYGMEFHICRHEKAKNSYLQT